MIKKNIYHWLFRKTWTLLCFNIWTPTWQNQPNGLCAQWRLRSAWHPPSLIRVFAVHFMRIQDPMLPHADSKDWSDWADAQADLSLRWAHRSFCCFWHASAYFGVWLLLYWWLKRRNNFVQMILTHIRLLLMQRQVCEDSIMFKWGKFQPFNRTQNSKNLFFISLSL